MTLAIMRAVLLAVPLAVLLAVLVTLASPVMAGGTDRPVSGVLAAANGPITAGPMGTAGGAMRKLAVGNKVFFEDEIITGDGVRAQILLRDGTTFSIGEGARLILDEFVFDPRTNEGGVGVVIKKGAFRFVSGKIAKANPRNMRVLAGNTAIAVRGTEVIGTVGSGAESVILISGQVDLVSIGGDCVASGSGGASGDMFGIGTDGGLEFNADVVAAPPDYCNRSLVRAGFGVQVAGGQIAVPGRIDTDTIDAVIDAITIKNSAEQSSQQSEQTAPADEEASEAAESAQPAAPAETGDAPTTETVSDPAESGSDAGSAPATVTEAAVSTVTDAAEEPKAEDTLSEFDKLVMRAFGLMEEDGATSESAAKPGESEPQGALVLAASLAEEEAAGEDKPEETSDTAEDSGRPDDDGFEEQVEDTPTEEEKRNEVKVEEAVLDLNKPKGEAESSEPTESEADPNTAPTLASISGIAFSDSANDDSFTLVSATLTGSDSDSGDTLTYSVTGGSSDTSVSGFTHSRTGTYGTLFLNSGSGAYRYVPNDSAIEGLKSDTSEDFTLSVSDGTASASQTLTASITGADDTLTVAALSGITLTDTANDDSFTTTTGSVSATERDTADTVSYAISGGSSDTSVSGFTHSRAGTYGTLFINSGTGAYQFVPADNAIERITSTVTEDFTVSVSSGSATVNETLTASVAGANDTPVFNAISAISLTDTTADDSFTKTTSTLSSSERDTGQTITYSATGQQAISGDPNFTHGVSGTYGALLFNANTGDYEYTPTDSLVNALRTDSSETFTFAASDSALSANQTLTVNIAGADDGPSAIDTSALAREGGTQNVGATGLRLAVVTDPEGDTVTDLTSGLNALPAWLSFGNQALGDGTVEYFWEIGANEAPWRAGTKAMNLKARSSGIDTAATSFSITFTCQTSHCGDFLQSTDTETSPAVYAPTNINQILTGMKIGVEDFVLLSEAERNALFDTGVTANGRFRLIYSSAETGSGSPAGSWGIDQTVNVDYKMRTIDVSGNISASNIGYFDGASDDFTYTNSMGFADTALGADSVFEKSARTSSNAGYDLRNSANTVVHIQLDDQIGFMVDANNTWAAVINTNIRPLSTNPAGYKDDTNNMIQQQWRVLEPQ
jgi:hypothetical protein